jgi:hypothetical protein
MSDLYETDILAWSEKQAEALRRRAANEVDWDNVAEEIADMGKRERRELYSRVRTILDHLIRLAISPATESRAGWLRTVTEQRAQLHLLLRDSPSLEGELADMIAAELPTARRLAALSLAEHGETPIADPATLTFDSARVIETEDG